MNERDEAAQVRRIVLTEIKEALRSASVQRRSRIVLGIADLFLKFADTLGENTIALFGEMLLPQAGTIDAVVLAEVSARLAPIANAPNALVRQLAYNTDAAVAAPMLMQGLALTTADLVTIARQSSTEHRLAIAQRAKLDEQVTQVLVERGEETVMNRLAVNPGARFTVAAFGAMLGHATADDRARVITRLPVRVLRSNGSVTGACVMTDISPGGAKLFFYTPVGVPELFTIELTAVERAKISGRVIWRRGPMLGLRFTEPLAALWERDSAEAQARA